jgi:hypothetical protein
MAHVDLAQVPEVLLAAFQAGDPGHEEKAQEQENLAALARIVGMIAMGRFDELREHLTPEVGYQLLAPAGFPWARHARGAEDVSRTLAENFAAVREQRPDVLALVAQGDTIMLMVRETGRWTRTGEEYDVLTAQQFDFDRGRLAAFRSVVGSMR